MSGLQAQTQAAGYPDLVLAGAVANIKLFVFGKPVPKGRPRSRIRGAGATSFVQVFTDEATVTWEDSVAWQVRQQLAQLAATLPDDVQVDLPIKGRVLVTLRFNLDRPASLKRSILYPVKNRTDVDNLAKAVLDALQNAAVIANDNLVTDCTISKRFAEPDHPQGVEIDLTGWLAGA